MAWKKPKWVSNVQKGAQNVANAVVPNKPPVLQQIQNVAQKAANAVGDVVRPAAQTVAKEVGSIVNPVVGEIALRGKQLAKDPTINKIGDAIAGEAALIAAPYKDRGPKDKMATQYNTGLQDDGSTAAMDKFKSEFAMNSAGKLNEIRNTANGAQASMANKRIDQRFEQDIGAGRVQPAVKLPWEMASGGSAVNAIPVPAPDVADELPAGGLGNQGKNTIGIPTDVPKADTNYDRFQQPVSTSTVSTLTGEETEEETQRKARVAMLARLKKRLKQR